MRWKNESKKNLWLNEKHIEDGLDDENLWMTTGISSRP